MRIRLVVFLGLLAIPTRGFTQTGSMAFSLTDKTAISTITNGTGSNGGTDVGYARIIPNSGSTPAGVAIFGYRPAGVLVSEAGVPASPLIKNGRIYAEVGPAGSNGQGTDIGLAIANPGNGPATISFSFTNTDGTDIGSGAYVLPAGKQFASYLEQTPWNVPLGFQGTFTFSSNVGISVVALQLYNNPRNEALITTLPVIDTSIAPSTSPAVLSHFTDGAGWSTSILLVNSTDSPMSGNIQFRAQDGTVLSRTANGQTSTSFSYTVARRSSFKLQTAGTLDFQSGSVTVSPNGGTHTPVSLAVFSFANSDGTVLTQAGVPSNSGTTFRMYVEATPGLSAAGTYSTGFAIANTTSSGGAVTFDLYNADGLPMGLSETHPIAPFGQIAGFLSDIFPSLTLPFQGVLRVTTSTAAISVVALRIRYNERPHEFLMTTTPPTDEAAATTTSEFDFPEVANGGGFTTQFILFSGTNGQTSNGNLLFINSDSSPLMLSTTSLTTEPAASLTSISPSRAAVNSTVTLTGAGFSASNSVVFTTSSGTVDVKPDTAASTTLTAPVPANAITGPVFVRSGSQASASLILEVLAASGSQIQTSINVGASVTTTGADIFVPPPAAGLSLTAIGVGDQGTSISFGPATATIARGSNKQMLLNGDGLSNTTSVSVSGTGITLSNLVFQNGLIFINISVASTASTGTRNVVVTNSNGDTSILTGGLLIQ